LIDVLAAGARSRTEDRGHHMGLPFYLSKFAQKFISYLTENSFLVNAV